MESDKESYATNNAENDMFKWTPDTILQLIELYRERPALYDPRQKHSREDRKATVNEIARILCVPDYVINAKLHSLRTSYAREKFRIQRCHEDSSGSTGKPWCYFSNLRFLDEFVMPRLSTQQTDSEFQQVTTPGTRSSEDTSQDVHSDSCSDDTELMSDTTETSTLHIAKKIKSEPLCDSDEKSVGSKATGVRSPFTGIDSDDIFGHFVTAELRNIHDRRCKKYLKLQIQNILHSVHR